MAKSEIRFIAGRNSVKEALKRGHIQRCFVQADARGGLTLLVEELRKRNVPILEVSVAELQKRVPGVRHQGIIAELPPFVYADLEIILRKEKEKEDSLLILLDGIEDPHNLGAIIRTADAAGAAAVLLPEHRNASVTEIVHKTSAGAAEWIPIVRIGNVVHTMKQLQKQGYWITGTDMDAPIIYTEASFSGKVVLVLGNEGKGMSRLTKETCDFMVRIPMFGHVSSLNVSVAAALLMYQVAMKRVAK